MTIFRSTNCSIQRFFQLLPLINDKHLKLHKVLASDFSVLAQYSCFSDTTSKLLKERSEKLTATSIWCGLQRVRGPQADRRKVGQEGAGCDRGMAGWVSPGTAPPVSVHLKSFAWLIRDDRTAAPNLQSAVTRGQCRRRSMGVAHFYRPGHTSAPCVGTL